MKAYVVQTAKKIEPLGDHPRDCLIANRRLAEWQEDALQQLGLRPVATSDAFAEGHTEEHVVFEDRLYFTPELLAEFISRSRALGVATVCALRPGLTTLRTIVATQEVQAYPDRVEYRLWYAPGSAQRDGHRPVVIEVGQLSEVVPWPEHMLGCAAYRVPLTERLIVSIDHWANLWAANIATLMADGARLRKARKIRLLWLALKARSVNQWDVLRQINTIGNRCDIHPTAHVEGSAIGDGVRIGAGAVVRESVIGNGAYVGNNATSLLSIMGDGSVINDGAVVNYSVLYPGAFDNSRYVNVSLLGRDTFLGEGVTLADFRFDRRSVTVVKDGVVVDTGNTFLGCCLGHGVYVGAGCLVAPGRAVPNGWRIVADDDRIVRRCNPDTPLPGHLGLVQEPPGGPPGVIRGNAELGLQSH